MQRAQDMMHITVAGCGPAGMFIAAACALRGLRVALVSPTMGQRWVNQYGAWLDEFAPLGLDHTFAALWSKAGVWLDEARQYSFDRAYGVIDNDALAAHLKDQCSAAGVRFYNERVCQVEHDRHGSTVVLGDGTSLRTSVFIDATGHKSPFIKRHSDTGPTSFQTAYGVLTTVRSGPEFDPQTMVWMDWRPIPGMDQGWPTFLYAMPMPDGRVFLEETALVGRPAISFDVLKARLHRRLEHMGIEIGDVDDIERCHIPMDTPMPVLGQRSVGFGAAASMIHPATGYMVSHIAARARVVADVLARNIDHTAPAGLCALAWQTIWSQDDVRTHSFYSMGADTLLGFDAPELRDFYAAFFSLPPARWRRYLTRELDPGQLASTMWTIYTRCSPKIRAELRRSSYRQPGRVLHGLLGLRSPLSRQEGVGFSRSTRSTPTVQESFR